MYILNERGLEILNSDFIQRFAIAQKPDAALIVASYGETERPITMGRYKNLTEAKDVLMRLYAALRNGEPDYELPPSSYYDNESIRRDARTKRKGGS